MNNGKNLYDRDMAVRYALAYAYVPNPAYLHFASYGDGGGDCTNFISQCLAAGGAPFDYMPDYPWWYKSNGSINVSDDKWSLSWAVANSLYWCLKIRGKKNIKGLKGIEISDVNSLQSGDIIQYENARGNIYHSAIITGFIKDVSGQNAPLITQHTYNAANIYYIKPAAHRAHFMKIIVD